MLHPWHKILAQLGHSLFQVSLSVPPVSCLRYCDATALDQRRGLVVLIPALDDVVKGDCNFASAFPPRVVNNVDRIQYLIRCAQVRLPVVPPRPDPHRTLRAQVVPRRHGKCAAHAIDVELTGTAVLFDIYDGIT